MKNKRNVINRLGIFVFYDKEGIVDEYITYLLSSLCECLKYLIIIVNGYIDTNGMNIFQNYTDKIYIRDNEGFDGGAYKDIILNEIGQNTLKEYDEIVFCNSTFFGPFIPFSNIFEQMKVKDCDFWGLNYIDNRISNHIQSYFLVFRRNVIQNNHLWAYFLSNIDYKTKEISDIYADFEFGLFYYLLNEGYTFDSYTENRKIDIYRSSNIHIKYNSFPILKTKSFSPQKIELYNIIDAIQYICRTYDYDINMILDNARRIYNFTYNINDILNYKINETDLKTHYYNISRVSEKEILDFVANKTKIYVYGAGSYAGKITRILDHNNVSIEGYIVSDDQKNISKTKNRDSVHKISEIDLIDDIVIIVALDKKNTETIKKYLADFNNVIYLW